MVVYKTLRHVLFCTYPVQTPRCKEIWVVGANRYRNPEQDLPTDFEQKKVIYYQALSQPTDGNEFITSLQQKMAEELENFDLGLKKNSSVKILTKRS